MTGPSPPRTCGPIPRTADPLTAVGGQQPLAPLGEQSGLVGVGISNGSSRTTKPTLFVVVCGQRSVGSEPWLHDTGHRFCRELRPESSALVFRFRQTMESVDCLTLLLQGANL